MKTYLISGTVNLPKEEDQKRLHYRIGQYVTQLNAEKDAADIQKDKQKSVPISMLPMVF